MPKYILHNPNFQQKQKQKRKHNKNTKTSIRTHSNTSSPTFLFQKSHLFCYISNFHNSHFVHFVYSIYFVYFAHFVYFVTHAQVFPQNWQYTGSDERKQKDVVRFVGVYAIDHAYLKQSLMTQLLGVVKSHILRNILPSQKNNQLGCVTLNIKYK